MSTDDLFEEAKRYLISYLKGKNNRFEQLHPWRMGWEFVVLHSLRVEAYVLKLLEEEGGSLPQKEANALRLAAILHDIGRTEILEKHALRSAQIVKSWLQQNPPQEEIDLDREKLFFLIETHSDKSRPQSDLASAILKDADLLDEVGVLSIFMTSNQVDRDSPFFFNQLYDQLGEYELAYCDRQLKRLNTSAARAIMESKKEFVRGFIAQLNDELDGTHTARDLIFRGRD